MFSFAKKFFEAKANPIGVDFGTDSLRLAQVQPTGESGEYKLLAAASCDVPSHVRNHPASRLQFFVETTRDLLAQGNFQGRQAVLGLPAASMFIQHLRMAKLDEAETKKALPWEARGKLPMDPSHAVLRHLIAGEVYHDTEPKNEVILMAAARELVNQLLAAASKAKLDIVGMNVEPKALIDAFTQIYRRKTDGEVVNCFVDIGAVGTRAIIARGREIFFARNIPVGGDHFTRATASALHMSFEEAKLLRIKLGSSVQPVDNTRERASIPAPAQESAGEQAADDSENSFALLAVATRSSGVALANAAATRFTPPAHISPDEQASKVQTACAEQVTKLIEELTLCRRYYEATFPNRPVDRLVFVGGEARHRNLGQQIAREMGLAAQIGDPLVRMGRISDIGIESGIDRRQPQPGWAVVIGLSMGPGATGSTEAHLS
jgi:type IV pilus assembly protein PilM